MESAVLNIGDRYEVDIFDVSTEGSGIGRIGNMVVFVDGAILGDRVLTEITKVKKKFCLAKAVKVIEESSVRDYDTCPYNCGGCSLDALRYEEQLKIKEKQVKNKLEKLGGVDFANSVFNPVIDSPETYRYRNKAVMAISTGGLITKKGGVQVPVHEPHIGFMAASSHNVADCPDCRLQTPAAMAAAEATRQFMAEDNISSYDARWDKGLMKSMTVRTAFGTGEVMVIYDINGKGIPGAGKLIGMLDEAVYEAGIAGACNCEGNRQGGSYETESYCSVEYDADSCYSLECVAVRMRKGNRTATEVIAGKPTIEDLVKLPGLDRELRFEISPDSFYQVNPNQMVNLYSKVREYCLGVSVKMVVLDLYCGIGTIGLCVADIASHVYGVESVKAAVLDANRNATINGIVNATYTCGKAEDVVPQWIGGTIQEADIAIVDPPRAGCKPELLQAIAEANIPNIIYVSCDPATLSRDVRLLRERGYELLKATPVDMFPMTGHVETVCLMSRVEGK